MEEMREYEIRECERCGETFIATRLYQNKCIECKKAMAEIRVESAKMLRRMIDNSEVNYGTK